MNEKILVVEDDAELRNVLHDFLKIIGYQVTTAENALNGLEEFMKKEYEIVITDINMPGKMNGVDVVRRIKAFRPSTRIFVCTGYSDNLSSIENVAHEVIRKPFDLNQIKDLLNQKA